MFAVELSYHADVLSFVPFGQQQRLLEDVVGLPVEVVFRHVEDQFRAAVRINRGDFPSLAAHVRMRQDAPQRHVVFIVISASTRVSALPALQHEVRGLQRHDEDFGKYPAPSPRQSIRRITQRGRDDGGPYPGAVCEGTRDEPVSARRKPHAQQY